MKDDSVNIYILIEIHFAPFEIGERFYFSYFSSLLERSRPLCS